MKQAFRRVLAAVLAPLLVSCTSWGAPLALSRLTTDRAPRRARVTLADGRQLVVEHPRLRGDTLFGDTINLKNLDGRDSVPVAIPFAGCGRPVQR